MKKMMLMRSLALNRRILRMDLRIIKGLNMRKRVKVYRVTPQFRYPLYLLYHCP